jgi:hypothetical protein
MADDTKVTQTWSPNVPHAKEAAAKYGGHEGPAAADGGERAQPNPSSPGNTGTTPGTNAQNG